MLLCACDSATLRLGDERRIVDSALSAQDWVLSPGGEALGGIEDSATLWTVLNAGNRRGSVGT